MPNIIDSEVCLKPSSYEMALANMPECHLYIGHTK